MLFTTDRWDRECMHTKVFRLPVWGPYKNIETPDKDLDTPELRENPSDDLDDTYIELDDDFIDEYHATNREIGRASCRERVCLYV